MPILRRLYFPVHPFAHPQEIVLRISAGAKLLCVNVGEQAKVRLPLTPAERTLRSYQHWIWW